MTQLDLEWREHPRPLDGGVVDAVVAWCACGWRSATSSYSRSGNRERAGMLFRLHRERGCPFASLGVGEHTGDGP